MPPPIVPFIRHGRTAFPMSWPPWPSTRGCAWSVTCRRRTPSAWRSDSPWNCFSKTSQGQRSPCHASVWHPLRSAEDHHYGLLKILWLPIRLHTMCGSPSTTELPYSKVALPLSAQVISKMPDAPFTPLTRSPFRNPFPCSKSSTNCATAARNASCCPGLSASKSAPKRANQAYVGKVGLASPPLSAPLGACIESVEELISRVEILDPTGGEVSISLALARLPIGRPEPCLRGIDQLLRTQKDAIRRDLRLQKVTLF